MTDAELKAVIQEEVRRTEDHLAAKFDLAQAKVEGHLSDRFAHGWDHQLIETSRMTLEEWMKWRAGVDKFRWFITGGLVLLATEIPTAAAIVIAMVKH